MPANYVLLGEVTLGASAASVTFSNIPQTGYTDLKVVVSARLSTNVGANWYDLGLTFNGSSTSYSGRYVLGNGSSAASGTDGTSAYIIIRPPSNTATASTFGNCEVYVPNYTSSNYKSVSIDNVSETNATSAIAIMTASLWSNTAAITSMTFTAATGNIVANSTFYLYGLAAVGTTPVIAPFASGGDVITNDGTYWIHTFLSSGTFTPNKALTCDYLVVAGGAGGGAQHGGGGGAGGLRSTVTATGGGGSLETSLSLLANTGYSAVIGAGGAGTTSISLRGANGANSTFSTITSTGGGGGGSRLVQESGANGGSGGGSGYDDFGGNGTTNQGFAGGNDAFGGGGGGGGGAGVVGANAPSGTAGGNGGNGVATSITGSSVTYGGGGGGGVSGSSNSPGSGGSGGGGAGTNNSTTGIAGTTNLGGGGGAGGFSGSAGMGGNGGSGIVIVRYPIA
jgi:hypothetical protein